MMRWVSALFQLWVCFDLLCLAIAPSRRPWHHGNLRRQSIESCWHRWRPEKWSGLGQKAQKAESAEFNFFMDAGRLGPLDRCISDRAWQSWFAAGSKQSAEAPVERYWRLTRRRRTTTSLRRAEARSCFGVVCGYLWMNHVNSVVDTLGNQLNSYIKYIYIEIKSYWLHRCGESHGWRTHNTFWARIFCEVQSFSLAFTEIGWYRLWIWSL